MDYARDRYSGNIIDAEQLWEIETVDKDGYECPGCSIRVFPASYNKITNKKRPYFTARLNKHHLDCGIDGIEKLVDGAQDKAVGTPEGFPVPFPNRLNLDEERPVKTGREGNTTREKTEITRTRSKNAAAAIYHGHTVKTIRPICRIFMKFPHDRDTLSLNIPDCYGNTYKNIFRGLGFFGIQQEKIPTRLFYAPLNWGNVIENEKYIEWKLDAGEWPKGQKRPSRIYKVRVMWSDWTKRQRKVLRDEIEISREEVKEISDKNTKAWLFFVGTQDNADNEIFIADRYPLICCLVGKMYWPKTISKKRLSTQKTSS